MELKLLEALEIYRPNKLVGMLFFKHLASTVNACKDTVKPKHNARTVNEPTFLISVSTDEKKSLPL
jgi:hypothetical protein